MRKIKEILRLKYGTGLSKRKIALCCNVSHSTVSECLVRAAKAKIGWPLSEGLDDRRLEELLYPAPVRRVSEPATPDWAVVHTELKRKGVTLQLLWEEYQERHADGWQYSWFCEHYQEYSKKLNPSMRQVHKAGSGGKRTAPLRLRIAARDSLDKDSDALTDQVRAIDDRHLVKGPLAKLSETELNAACKAVGQVMGCGI